MTDDADTLTRIRGLLGRTVVFDGRHFRLAEVLDDPATVILAPLGPLRGIVADSYGHPAGRGPEFLELPVFDERGELSEALRAVAVVD